MKIQLTRDSKGFSFWPGETKLHVSTEVKPDQTEHSEWFDDECETRGSESLWELADLLIPESEDIRGPDETPRRYVIHIERVEKIT